MTNGEKDFAVQVAAEAARSGDAESIADAKIALESYGLDDHAVHRQLDMAAALLDPKRALAGTSEAAFVDLLAEAWKRKQLATVSYGFSRIGIGVSEAEVAAIGNAIAKANGKRRTELITAANVIAIAVEVTNGAASARFPADDRRWFERVTPRSVCVCSKLPDGFRLEIGTETVGSYSAASRTSTELDLTLGVATIDAAALVKPATAIGPLPATAVDPLPETIRARLLQCMATPTDDGFRRALDVLAEIESTPHADAAIRFVDRFVALWPDPLRHLPWTFKTRQLTPKLQPLVRSLQSGLAALHEHAERWPSGPLFSQLTELHLLDLEDPQDEVLQRFSELEKLALKTIPKPSLRFPASLRRVALDVARESDVASLVTRLREDCPALERVDAPPFSLPALAALPEHVAVGTQCVWPGDAQCLNALGTRVIAELRVVPRDEVRAELAATGASARVRALHLEAAPGQLEALLRDTAWPALTGLTVELPARSARMNRRKPPDYTFTKGDIDALASASVFPQLEQLDLIGILGDELGAAIAAALVRAKPALRRLALNASECGNATLATLISSGVLAQVTELELFRSKIKAKGFALFIEPGAPTALTKLVLAKNAVTRPALEDFAAWSGLAKLKRLDLREVTLSSEQRELLAAAPHLRFEALDASDNPFW